MEHISMSRWLLALVMLAGPTVSIAQDSYYQKIHYRDDDPFLFCTKGMNIPDPCWVPISDYTGQWTYTGLCDPPNSETGRPWTTDDHRALKELETRCPHAKHSGSWNPQGGAPEITPHVH